MPIDASLLERLRSRGEEVFTQLSADLMSNPRFVKAMEGALRGKEKVEDAAGQAIKTMNIPTRSEFKKALARIDALEREVSELKARRKTAAKAKTKMKTNVKTRAGARSKKTKTAG